MKKDAFGRPLAAPVLALALLSSCFAGCKKNAEDAPEPSVLVEAAHPTVGPISESVDADAILAPLSQAALSPRTSAPIRAEYVQRGAHVRRGQLLLTLEGRDVRGNAVDSKGAVDLAAANYKATTQATVPETVTKAQKDAEQTKVAYEVAQRTTLERQKLFHEGALSGRDADLAVAAEAQAEAAYENARIHAEAVTNTTRLTDAQTAAAQLRSARGRLESAEAQVSYTNLRSPIDGLVTDRPLFPGETATAGTTVLTVMDTSSLLAKLHLAQATAQKLTLGHKATVQVPGLQEPVLATVSFISPALDPGSTTVEIWLKLPNPDGRLKVGTPVHTSIVGNTVNNAVQVPATAIVPGQDAAASVMVIGPDGAAHRRPVAVGIRREASVQILSGVTPADLVITSGGYGLDEGTKVQQGKVSQAGGEGKGQD